MGETTITAAVVTQSRRNYLSFTFISLCVFACMSEFFIYFALLCSIQGFIFLSKLLASAWLSSPLSKSVFLSDSH